MSNVVNIPIKPKQETHTFQGQRYTLAFDPKAPPDQRWVWILRYTSVFTFTGSAATITRAQTAARAKIRKLNNV